MAVSRVFSRSHPLLSRGLRAARIVPSIRPSMRVEFSHRLFTSSANARLDTVQTPSRGEEVSLTENYAEPTGSNASGIALLRLPKRATRAEIEALLQSKGFEVKRMQLSLDRFTFENNTIAFAELGNEQQASAAQGEMSLGDKSFFVRPLKADFNWYSLPSVGKFGGGRYFLDKDDGAHKAVRPLLEGRRMMLLVETPGWSKKGDIMSDRTTNSMDVIERHFKQYDVEAVSGMSPFRDSQAKLRMLCLIDFKTKENAENALRDLNHTTIEGRQVQLQPAIISSSRAVQLGKVSGELLAELQEKGLASKEPYEYKPSDRKKSNASSA